MDYTPLLKLALPPFDEVPWDEAINNNSSILDAAVGRFFSVPGMTGVWKNATPYSVGQSVVDDDAGSIWTCVVAYTSAAAPITFIADRTAHPSVWAQTTASAQGYAAEAANSAASAAASAAAAAASVSGTFAGQVTAASYRQTGSGSTWTGNATNTDWFMDAGGWVLRYTRATGRLGYYRGGDGVELFAIDGTGNIGVPGTINNLWVARQSDLLCFNSLGGVAGHGAYIDLSDERMKCNIATVSIGMDAVRELSPISFNRVLPDGTQKDNQEYGFSAQQVQRVVPQAVMPFSDDKIDPLLGVTAETLLAVAWNAIKELDARLAALEGGRAAGANVSVSTS